MRLVPVVLALAVLLPLSAGAQKRGGGNSSKKKQAAAKSDPSQSPYTEPNPAYPLKVELLLANHQSESDGHYVTVKTFGSGNVLGDKMVGFDYKSSCSGGLETGTYQSKWKKQDKKIEVLTLIQGKTKSSTCTIDVEMKTKPYARPKDPNATSNDNTPAATTDTTAPTPAASDSPAPAAAHASDSTDSALKDSTAAPATTPAAAPADDAKPVPPGDSVPATPAAPAAPASQAAPAPTSETK